MRIYKYGEYELALLKNTTHFYYRDDGTLNLDFLETLLDHYQRSATSTDGLIYLYYILQSSMAQEHDVRVAQRFWNITFDKFDRFLSSLYQEHFYQLQQHGVLYHSHVAWLIQSSDFLYSEDVQTHTETTLNLTELGLSAYVEQGHFYDASIMRFLPESLRKHITIEDAIRFGYDLSVREMPLDVEELLRLLPDTDPLDIRRFFTIAAFASYITVQNDAVVFDFDQALQATWSYFERYDVSLEEVISVFEECYGTSDIFTASLAWIKDPRAQKYPKALNVLKNTMDRHLALAIASKPTWDAQDFVWADLLSHMSSENSMYDTTRIRLAESIADRYDQDLPISEALSLALAAGPVTFTHLLSLWRGRGSEYMDECMFKISDCYNSSVLAPILCHPLFQQHVDTELLFHHLFYFKEFDYEDLYKSYVNMTSMNWTYIFRSINRMAEYHQLLNNGKSLKDTIGTSHYVQLWSILGVHLYVDTQTSLNHQYVPVPEEQDIGFPDALHAIMVLDPVLFSKHRDAFASILMQPESTDAVAVYKNILADVFGPLYADLGLHDIMISNGHGLVQFFAQLYLQQHPDLGIGHIDAIALDDAV